MIEMSLTNQDEKFWDLMNDEYRNIVNEFALSVFGIGALFFAVGQVSTPTLKELIDLIGFGASVTMWIHMHDASKQIQALRQHLRDSNPLFMTKNTIINSWRHKGFNRIFFYPVSRLMTYFMGLVALAWLELVINSFGDGLGLGLPLSARPTLLAIGFDALLFTFILALVRRSEDITRNLVRTPAPTITLAKEAWVSALASLIAMVIGLTQLTTAIVLTTLYFSIGTAPSALLLFTVGSLLLICHLLLQKESLRLLQIVA